MGKPDTTFLEIIAAETSLQVDEILVVGDSLESDIAMSNRFGSPSVFVMADSVDQPIESGAENLWPTLRLAALSDLPTLFATR